MNNRIRVVVVGAGLGGLCLAQALRQRDDVRVDVYERDASPWERAQGYRLHLDADGINALHDALSPELFAAFDATAMKAAPFTTIVDRALNIKMRRSHDQHGGTDATPHAGLPSHVNVNRATLREIVLSGIDVHFGKKLTGYEERADCVVASFDDGSQVEADILVGADGIRSVVRAQRAPDARTQDSGVRAIYGRVTWEAAKRFIPEQALADVFTVATDERKCFLGLGPVAFPQRPESVGLAPQDDYVVCIIGGQAEYFQEAGDDSAGLRQLAAKALAAWPESTRNIVAHADPDAFFLVEMWTSVPTTLPAPGRVTLLGDAIHAMTPTLGRGANLALRDGAALARKITDLAAYEAEMIPYGFDVVRTAAAMGERLMGQKPLP